MTVARLVVDYPEQVDVTGLPKPASMRVGGGRIVVDNYRGVLRVRFFSAEGHPVRDGPQRYQVDWFRAACSLWKVTDHRLRMQLEEASKKLHATGRDLFMVMLAGRMWIITTDDGRVLIPEWIARERGG